MTDGKLCRQETLSQPPIWSQHLVNSCWRGTQGEVNPAAQRLERHPVDALTPNPDQDPVPRRLYLKQRDFMAHGTSDHCPGCTALVSGSREEGQIRVEGELRKTEEGRTRLHAAAMQVREAPTSRELKTVLRYRSSCQCQRDQLSLLKPHRPALCPHLQLNLHCPRLQSKCLTKR